MRADLIAVEQGVIIDRMSAGGRVDTNTGIARAVPKNIVVHDEVPAPVIKIDQRRGASGLCVIVKPIECNPRAGSVGALRVIAPCVDDSQIPAHQTWIEQIVEADSVACSGAMKNVSAGIVRRIE